MNQRTILIVEDDLTLREAIVDTLDIASYKSLAADSGEAAIVLLNNEKPDMIISDINMPGINGHELLKIIKCKLPKIPVILITAYEDVVSVVSAVNAIRNGAIDYIVKPFEPRELID